MGDVIVMVSDSPVHTGVFEVPDGVAGGLGSVRLNGPTAAEEQLFNTTKIFE